MGGALAGTRIIEFAGIGPGPFCGMMLADHGAEVIRVERPTDKPTKYDPLLRGRKSITLDLKKSDGVSSARELCRTADGLIEGYRPGVMERLGLGPDVLLSDNAKLVFGRMTGWGQYGPYAARAGHDINYIALSGLLHTVGEAGRKPVPPMNYVGDFGGGGLMLAFGMVAALLAVKNGGPGQVIDCAMTDGSALLGTMTWGFLASGAHSDDRGVNRLDGGAHYYNTYECADGKYVSLGCNEPQFYRLFRELTGLENDPDFDRQEDPLYWPILKEKLAALFAEKTRDEWCAILEDRDVCFAPVLSLREAPKHPHNKERGCFVELDGVTQPAPAPRFSKTPGVARSGSQWVAGTRSTPAGIDIPAQNRLAPG